VFEAKNKVARHGFVGNYWNTFFFFPTPSAEPTETAAAHPVTASQETHHRYHRNRVNP
jgi:hypothetical protein